MKYLAAILILLAMAWTWSVSTREHSFGLEEHKALEMQVQDAIRAVIREKRPAATDVVFQQLFTETIKPGEEIRARFRYEVKEPMTDGEITAQIMEGAAKLGSSDGGRTWKWLSDDVQSPRIEFQKGTPVGPPGSERKPEAK